MKILGVYNEGKPYPVKIPDKFVEAVQKKIANGEDLSIGGRVVPFQDIFTVDNLLDEEDWTPEFESLVTPTKEEVKEQSLFDKYRESEWYRKAKMEKLRKDLKRR